MKPFEMTPCERDKVHQYGSKENVILHHFGNLALFAYLKSQRKFWAWVEKNKAKRKSTA